MKKLDRELKARGAWLLKPGGLKYNTVGNSGYNGYLNFFKFKEPVCLELSNNYLAKDRWRVNVSPKQSSLAFIEETTALDLNEDYQPVLSLLDKSRHNANSTSTEEVILIRGRVTVSF